jgi:hypothetical protein
LKKEIKFKIGDSEVRAVVHSNKTPKPTFLNVHDDEDTSVAAGKANIAKFGGQLIELVHSGERLITFGLGGQKYSFDPNRMFSDAGIKATLKLRSHYSTIAHAAIKKFADEYLAQFALNREPVILALHNTVDGFFSVASFTPSYYLGAEAADVFISPRRSKFDFFFVTDRIFFESLKKLDFNVVLQNNERATDDGSLSVHFAKLNIPYINIEAEMTHLDEQIEMLRAVRKIIGE